MAADLLGVRASCVADDVPPSVAPTYSYLLGLYLGDGVVSLAGRTDKLRVFLDQRYPQIIASCAAAMSAVIPANMVGLAPQIGCTEVMSYSRHWRCLFPQHGPGRKHLRPIVLADWQQEIVDEHPRALLRGLIHSDGCRFINGVHKNGIEYRYPTYEFKNNSQDIHGIFQQACDLLAVRWRHPNEKSTRVARRESVAILDTFIGPKT